MTDAERAEERTDIAFGDVRTLDSVSKDRLARLGDLSHVRIADGQPDVRGWEVKGPAGNRIGVVSELLVDTGRLKVRYVEVRLDTAVAEAIARAAGDTDPRIGASRYALVPIGIARADRARSRVYLGTGAAQLIGLPAREREELTRAYERNLIRDYGLDAHDRFAAPSVRGGEDLSEAASDHFYEAPHFDERCCFGPHRRAGERCTYLVAATGRQGDAG